MYITQPYPIIGSCKFFVIKKTNKYIKYNKNIKIRTKLILEFNRSVK